MCPASPPGLPVVGHSDPPTSRPSRSKWTKNNAKMVDTHRCRSTRNTHGLCTSSSVRIAQGHDLDRGRGLVIGDSTDVSGIRVHKPAEYKGWLGPIIRKTALRSAAVDGMIVADVDERDDMVVSADRAALAASGFPPPTRPTTSDGGRPGCSSGMLWLFGPARLAPTGPLEGLTLEIRAAASPQAPWVRCRAGGLPAPRGDCRQRDLDGPLRGGLKTRSRRDAAESRRRPRWICRTQGPPAYRSRPAIDPIAAPIEDRPGAGPQRERP
jgi:hypothetical protein